MNKKPLKKIMISVSVLILAVLAFSMPVFADLGPKASTTVILTNPPEEEYYMDLLEENREGYEYHQNIDESNYDPEMIELLKSSPCIPEGWHACLTVGSTGAPVFGSLRGSEVREGASHSFSYFGLPETYIIIIVTKSGKVYLSEVKHKTIFQERVEVYIENDAIVIKQGASLIPTYLWQLALTLIPTLIIEFLLMLLFRIPIKKNILIFLIANIATQTILSVLMTSALIHRGVFEAYLVMFFAEGFIVAAETLLYVFLMKDIKKGKAVAYGITANVVTMVSGFLIFVFANT